MKSSNYYEPRYIRNSNSKYFDYLFDDSLNKKTLFDNVFNNDKIILLGNAGIGKSTELQELFKKLWEKIETTGLVPYSINLKNFRSNNTFEDIIPNDKWQELPQIIFILDGLDEISNIEDFISAFEVFIAKKKHSNYKYVLSCRTNVYEKYLVNISNFETYYLEDLEVEQAKSILLNKHNINFGSLDIRDSHYTYLKTPFFLDLFAEYYLSERKLPDSDALMWDIYVNKQLKNHKEGKVKKKRILNIPEEINSLKKVALINEFRQENYIHQTELNELFGNQYLDFIENPFILSLEHNNEKYSFEHRQLQEYFVAKALSNKSFEEILSHIKIEQLDRIHPTLFNSVSFLINLIENEEIRQNLIDWIEKNEIELIFKADSDRINDKVRNNVFQNFFRNHCIEKSYWISTNNPFTAKQIGEFACTIQNYLYLKELIEENNHFRIVISAIEILSFFDLNKIGQREEYKNFILFKLKQDKYNESIKSYLVDCINVHSFAKNDEVYLNSIFEIFRNCSNKQLNRSLLSLLIDQKNIDNFFEFIKNEFFYENNIKIRAEKDQVIRGTSYTIEQLLLKLKRSDDFIEIIKYYFDEEYNIFHSTLQLEKLLDKSLEFEKKDENFIIKLISQIKFKTNYIHFSNELMNLIFKLNKKSKSLIIHHLLNEYDFKDVSYQLSRIFIKEELDFLLLKINKKNVDKNEIESFRNSLANSNNRELGKTFNDLMINKGHTFKELFLSDDEIENLRNLYKNKPQENFDNLFNPEKLIEKIKLLYEGHGEYISIEDYQSIEKNWYEKNGHWNRIDGYYDVLRNLTYKHKTPISLKDIEELLNNEDYLIKKKIDTIKNDKNNELHISIKQKQNLKKWVKAKIKIIDFNKLISLDKYDSFNILEHYSKWELSMFLIQKFDFDVSKEFLLESMKFFYVNNNIINEKMLFSFLIEKVNNVELIKNQIEKNLKSDFLISNVVKEHILFALKNNLENSYSDIKRHLINEDSGFNLKEIYELFLDKFSNDFNFIENCTRDIEKYKTWDIIAILNENNLFQDFCIDMAINYLEEIKTKNINNSFISNSLRTLFKYNDPKAIEFYISYIQNSNLDFDIPRVDSYNNYNYIDDYNILIKLFNKIYLDETFDNTFNGSTNFLNQYIANISKVEESHLKVIDVLLKRRNEIRKRNDSGYFNINLLIDVCENSYYVSKSKPLNFSNALEKVNKILN